MHACARVCGVNMVYNATRSRWSDPMWTHLFCCAQCPAVLTLIWCRADRVWNLFPPIWAGCVCVLLADSECVLVTLHDRALIGLKWPWIWFFWTDRQTDIRVQVQGLGLCTRTPDCHCHANTIRYTDRHCRGRSSEVFSVISWISSLETPQMIVLCSVYQWMFYIIFSCAFLLHKLKKQVNSQVSSGPLYFTESQLQSDFPCCALQNISLPLHWCLQRACVFTLCSLCGCDWGSNSVSLSVFYWAV